MATLASDTFTPSDNPAAASPNGEVRNSFGPKPDQTVPRSWADRMLTKLATDHRPVFVKLLGEAALGAE